MNNSHTPGDWHISWGRFDAAIYSNMQIAMIEDSAEEWKANAILLSAAPAMLSALQTALDCFYNLQSEQRWDKEEGDHIEEAFDAIEKINLAILKATNQ